MYTHEHELRVSYADTDQMGIVYHANYFKYFEIGRVEALRSTGMAYRDLEQKYGLMLPVFSVKARFIRPAQYDDNLLIETNLLKISEKHMFFSNMIYSMERKIICNGEVVLYFMEVESKRRIDCPDVIRNWFEKY